MEYMLTFHIVNVYVDKTQPRQFKFTFKDMLLNSHISKSVLSSTYLYKGTGVDKSFIYIIKHLGPQIVPCGRGDRGWLSHGLVVTLPISYSLDGGILWGFTCDMRIAY